MPCLHGGTCRHSTRPLVRVRLEAGGTCWQSLEHLLGGLVRKAGQLRRICQPEDAQPHAPRIDGHQELAVVQGDRLLPLPQAAVVLPAQVV